jgi:hypothetical protein
MRKFEELKDIWNTQNTQNIYTINEEAVRTKVSSAKKSATHVTNRTEQIAILVNFGVGAFLLSMNISVKHPSISLYVMAIWALVCGCFFLINRIRRTKENKKFDRSIQGELNHAISIATYQVQISKLMRMNIIPTAALIFISFWETGKLTGVATSKSIALTIGLFIFFALGYWFSGWEHNLYKTRKQNLETLKQKLESVAE